MTVVRENEFRVCQRSETSAFSLGSGVSALSVCSDYSPSDSTALCFLGVAPEFVSVEQVGCVGPGPDTSEFAAASCKYVLLSSQPPKDYPRNCTNVCHRVSRGSRGSV